MPSEQKLTEHEKRMAEEIYLGVHRNTVQNKLNGESEFTFEQAQLIADVFFPEYKPSFLFKRFAA